MIEKHAELIPVREGSSETLGIFNILDWGDREAAELMMYLLNLHVRRVIHTSNKGAYDERFQGMWGRLFFQFRTFMLSAYEGQFVTGMQGISQGDKKALAQMMTNSFFGGVSYMVSIASRYAGDEEKLKEYLTPEQVMKGMLFRSAWFTLGAPITDTLMMLTGNSALFAHGRSSGMASDFLTGSPAVAFTNSAVRAVKSLIAPIVNPEYEFSQQDWRAWKTVAPLHNMTGFASLWHHAPEMLGLPEKSKGN
jgi:hypothetical protein